MVLECSHIIRQRQASPVLGCNTHAELALGQHKHAYNKIIDTEKHKFDNKQIKSLRSTVFLELRDKQSYNLFSDSLTIFIKYIIIQNS